MKDGQLVHATIDSPVGLLLITGHQGAIVSISFLQGRRSVELPADGVEDPSRLAVPIAQLDEYFRGRRRSFDLTLDPVGTSFQREVWRALQAIPYGETRSYGEVARSIGRPGASRAVGAANGANPIPIVIPCHRVIGSAGSLTGFGGGLATKRFLLDLEAGTPEFSFANCPSGEDVVGDSRRA